MPVRSAARSTAHSPTLHPTDRPTAPGCRGVTRRGWLALAVPATVLLGACGSLLVDDPPRVDLVGLQGLPGEGLEVRFLARLRVQNPSTRVVSYEGVSLELDLRGQRFASGVAPLAGQVPGYGETVLEVPVSVSAFALARQILDLLSQAERGGRIERVAYALSGKLGGGAFGGTRFSTRGEVDLGRLAR